MYKIGLSSCGFSLTENNFEALHNAGISAIEISMPAEAYKDINYKEVEALSRKHEVGLWSYHLPFGPFSEIDPSSPDSGIRKHTMEYFSDLIKKGADIGIDKFVVHASGEPISAKERPERMKYSMQSLAELAEVAAKNGACIAVEDLPRTCLGNSAEDVLRLISVNDKLKVCFDTNHLLEDNNLNFMSRLADKIVTVHVSDYDFVNERHWLPGEGKLDWKAMIAKFREISYNGMWMYEIDLKCPKTIIRDRDLTFEDFYRNATEIFTGSELTVFSRQKENLGMWY